MAIDKAIDSAALDASLTAVADAIRAKGGTNAALAFPGGFVDAIEAISTGGESGGSDTVGTSVFGNLMGNFLHAVTSGTAATGEFTLATAVPNTETLIFDSGLNTIHGFAFVNVDWDGTITSTQRTAFGMALMNPDAGHTEYINNVQTPFLCQYRYDMNNGAGIGAAVFTNYSSPLSNCEKIRIDGGAFYVVGRYNNNANYTPFAPGMKYQWFAW